MCARGQMWLIAVSERKTLWWAGSRRLSTSHTRVRSQFVPSGICGTQSVTGRISFSNTSVLPHQLLFHHCSLLFRHQRLAHCVHQTTRPVLRTRTKMIIILLAPEWFFLILAHPVYKMWIIQEPNTLELWNKLHFEEKNTESVHHV